MFYDEFKGNLDKWTIVSGTWSIAFRVQDDDHFYVLLIDKANGTLQLYWTEDGGDTLNPFSPFQ